MPATPPNLNKALYKQCQNARLSYIYSRSHHRYYKRVRVYNIYGLTNDHVCLIQCTHIHITHDMLVVGTVTVFILVSLCRGGRR